MIYLKSQPQIMFNEMFTSPEELYKQANMKYIHIIVDVDAGVKTYHVQWNQ